MFSRCAVRVVGGETLLRKDVQSGKQAKCFIAVEIINVAESFLVQQLECQQAQQSIGSRNHFRTGIVSSGHKPIESQLREQRQKKKDPRMSSDDSPPSIQ